MFVVNTHGEERTKKVTVEAGRQEFVKREKYCTRHGWIDVFAVGGDLAWRRLHQHCNTMADTGAFVELPKIMKRAA